MNDNLKKHNNYKNELKISKARLAALEAISEVSKNKAFVREVLDNSLSKHALSKSDRAFATKLATGVTQTRQTLDNIIYRCVKAPEDIKQNVMNALRLSTYEIIYLQKQHHAAVDQGVELVKTVEPRAKGLANLVLRRIVKLQPKFPFGNPDKDLQAFSLTYSVPAWLTNLLIEDMGNKKARYLIASSNGQPPCYVFVNQIKTGIDEAVKMFDEIGAKPQQINSLCGIKLSSCIHLQNPSALQNHRAKKAMKNGWFLISDIASQAVCEMVLSNSKNPKNMLEACSGSGNKTIILQSLAQKKWGKQLDLYVLDNKEFKINELKHRAKEYGVAVSKSFIVDATDSKELDNVLSVSKISNFDIVFVDTPCSGLGTLRRHPEIKYRITPQKIKNLGDTSLSILENVSKYVVWDGFLAYATCTVTNYENQAVAIKFLKSSYGKDFKLMKLPVKNMTDVFYSTQTVGGLNDCHFAVKFVKK